METKQKNYINFSWIIFIAMAAIGIILAKTLFDLFNVNGGSVPMNIYVFDLLIVLFGFFACTFVYFIGKIIFSKLAGFEIVYANYIFIGFKKVNGSIKVFWGGRDDYSCKVQIAPKKENANLLFAHLGGTLLSILVVSITLALTYTLNTSSSTKFFFSLSSVFYAFSVITFMIPVRMDRLNDGFTLRMITNKKLKATFISNLNNFKALYNKDGGELSYFDTEGATDPISLEAELYNYYYLLDNNEIEKANEKISFLTLNRKNLIEETQVSEVFIGRIYMLCLKGDIKELNDYYWKLDNTTRSLIQGKRNYEGIKTALYIACYLDKSQPVYKELLLLKDKVRNKYLFASRLEKEDKLIEDINNKILEDNPDWKN